jgi:hypothetical protein
MSLAVYICNKYSREKFYSKLISALYYSKESGSVKFSGKDRHLGKKKEFFKKAKLKI